MKHIKILAITLVLIMCLSVCATANTLYVPVELQAQLKGTVMLAETQGFPTQITDTNSVSQHVKTDGVIDGVTVLCPSHGNSIGALTIQVYKWAGDVSSTLKTTPLAQKRYSNFADNTYLTLAIDNPSTGDIMIHVCDGEELVSVWIPITDTVPSGFTQETYVNGSQVSGILLAGVSVHVEEDKSQYPLRDAYEYFIPGDYNVVEGYGTQDSSDHYDGENANPYTMLNLNTPNVAYAGYYNVDFGDVSPKGFEARIYLMQSAHFNDVYLHLDSPSGPMIANMRFHHDLGNHRVDWGDTHYWTTMTFKLMQEVTGVHDLYIVTREGNGPSYIQGKFRFTKEEVEDSPWEQERKEYQPVPEENIKDIYADTWVATDMLGRKLADHAQAGDRKENKDSFLFYFISSGQSGYMGDRAINNQKVVDNYAGDVKDIKNDFNYAPWSGGVSFWNESVYGYYTSYDTWVMRKQLELLTAAGIDCIAFDNSNGLTFPVGYMNMGREMHKMRSLGYDVPKMTFVLPWQAQPTTTYCLENLYLGMYSAGLFSDSWYYKDGKPLIMAYPGGDLTNSTGIDEVDAFHREINEFFTYRPCQASYKAGQTYENQWPWLEVYPQHGFVTTEDGGYEMVSVGVAQNSNDEVDSYCAMNAEGVYGRSYTYKDKFTRLSESSVLYGYNFQEQWERAFELDPEAVFITGWNEWFAGRADEDGQGTKNAMVDLWIDEYSRDAEPSKGQLQDNYYLQMVNNIRMFKGVSPTPVASQAKTIDVGGGFEQWSDVGPEFIGFKGGTEKRNSVNSQGFGTNYVVETGRNDIVLSKVARDDQNIYFYVQTADKLTSYTDKNWMRLYINSDRTYKTGWEGYDYIINRVSPTASRVTVEKYAGSGRDWKWETAATADYKVSGNEMMISVPRAVLGIGEYVDIEFKWADNIVYDGDISDFYVNGDTAPVGRFNYRFVESVENGVPTVDEPVDIENDVTFKTRKFVMMEINNPVAYSLGHRTLIDPASQAIVPQIVNDKTMVPIRFISESLGAKVGWEEATSSATIDFNGKHIVIKDGSGTLAVDGKTVALQTPAQTINDRMYVPLRDVAEGFGLDCYWEDPGLIIIGTNVFNKVYLDSTIVPEVKNLFGME